MSLYHLNGIQLENTAEHNWCKLPSLPSVLGFAKVVSQLKSSTSVSSASVNRNFSIWRSGNLCLFPYSTLTSSVATGFSRHGMPPPVCNPDLWPFDLENGVRVASKVGNFRSKFRHARLLGSRIIRYVSDRRMDRQTDRQTKPMHIAPFLWSGA